MSIFGGILSAVAGPIIGGIFNKKAQKSAHASSVQDTLLQLPRLRQSAEDAGFNPLTALLANGSGSFNAGGMGAAPLASTSVINNAVQGVSDVLTGRDEVERATEKAQLELAQVELERLKSGGASDAVAATQKAGVPHLGKSRTNEVLHTEKKEPTFTANPNRLAKTRGVDVIKPANTAGVFELENDLTGGPVTIPGDSEPWGIDELATGLIVGGPQVVYNWGKKLGAKMDQRRADKLMDEWFEREKTKTPIKPRTKQERIEWMRENYPHAYD